MTARVLVVDDTPANLKVMSAKLSMEYFEVIQATNGEEALRLCASEHPDLVLLDVMMPGMDGIEVCKRLKADPKTQHLPVVMITALDQPNDRILGLEAGADDFLTKPVNDIALLARLRSLIRVKMMIDELRMREETEFELGIDLVGSKSTEASSANILLVEDSKSAANQVVSGLKGQHHVRVESEPKNALETAKMGGCDLVIISTTSERFDGLRLCSQLRSFAETRNLPVLVIVEDGEVKRLARALDLGANDYLTRPVDRLELAARISTQLKRKRYTDRLRERLHASVELSITDPLTGLFNRRFLSSHLQGLLRRGQAEMRPLSLVFIDLDNFKTVNDTHGHGIGDLVLKDIALRIGRGVRGVDLACRYGGEEFVVVMPGTDLAAAAMVSERMRKQVADAPVISGDRSIAITASFGVTQSKLGDTPDSLIERADQALYRAKRAGRNRVEIEPA
jgi:two-component system cell cycle response regulator